MERIYLANLLTTGSKENKAKLIEEAERENLYSLETFYKEKAVSKVLEEHPKIKIFLDSGAHSLINQNTTISCVTIKDEEKGETVSLTVDDFFKLSNNDQVLLSALRTGGSIGHGLTRIGAMKTGVLRRFIDFSFNESNEVKQYFEAYIAYVKKNEKRLYGYVNLDVIFNPQKSWDNQKYMESCGLKPLPVYHFGEDCSWLKKYMDNHDYIGVGGLGQDITKDKFISTFGDETWRYILSSKQKIRIHGFAVTSFELLKRYDWATVDSVVGSSMLLIREHGRIRLETIEELYRLYSRTKKKLRKGCYYCELENIETYVTDNLGVGKWKKINKVHRHNITKSTYLVHTRRGRKLELTDDHGLFKFSHGKIECVPTNLIKEGDVVVGVDYKEGFGNLSCLTVEILKDTYTAGNGKRTATKRYVPRKVNLDVPFLTFLGLWFADGSFTASGDSAPGLSVANDPECLEVVRSIAGRFKSKASVSVNKVDCSVSCIELGRIMKALGCVGSSHTKEVPWWVFELPESGIGAFLLGYWSGDGTANGFTVGSVSRKLAYGVFYLLSKLGIDTRITDDFDKAPKEYVINGKKGIARPGVTIQISGVGALKKFQEKVGFLQVRKNKLVQEEISKVSEERGLRDKKDRDEIYLKVLGVVKRKGRNNQAVYDLSVEDGERFVANGLLVHNSTTWVKHAAYGNTVVPGRNSQTGKLDINCSPILVYVSSEGLLRKTKGGLHYTIKYPKKEQLEIEEYFKSIGVDIQKAKDSLYERMLANVRYFQRLSSDEFVSDMQHLVGQRRRLF